MAKLPTADRMDDFHEGVKELRDKRERKMGNIVRGFDKGLRFKETYKFLIDQMKKYEYPLNDVEEKRLGYIMILLIGLRNAARINEACRSFLIWLATGKREFYIRVSKQKQDKDKNRIILIPEEIGNDLRKSLEFFHEFEIDLKKLVMNERYDDIYRLTENAGRWARKHKIGTHSMRYSRITHMSDKGMSPIDIAQITGHANLDELIRYVQEEAAIKKHRELK